ncbi:SRPBCC family protein [Nocardia sp. NPDC059195]|uniref:SRPBCC family protein n=1 Tax=Nocardia sp. NPDC059195 TaxID=3346765 RepID=UPI00367D66FF
MLERIIDSGSTTGSTPTPGRIAALTERFYRWDDQRRMTFTVDAASIAGLRRFAEDIELAPTATGTRLTWTFAVEGKPALQLLLRSTSAVTDRVTAPSPRASSAMSPRRRRPGERDTDRCAVINDLAATMVVVPLDGLEAVPSVFNAGSNRRREWS